MRNRRKLLFILSLVLLLFSISVVAQESTIVYIAESGSKYHTSGCRYLNKSKIEIELNDALERGYEPCKVCCPSKGTESSPALPNDYDESNTPDSNESNTTVSP